MSNELAIKLQATAVSTGALTLSGEQTIDGVAVKASDRVLVRAQTAGSQNGIWVCDSGSWIRADDFTGDQAETGTQVYIAAGGTAYGDTTWVLTTANPIVIGATALTFTLETAAVGSIATEETSPDGTELFPAEETDGTPKKITLDTISVFIAKEYEISETLTASATIASTLRHHFLSASTGAVTAELPSPSTAIKDQEHTITPIDNTYMTSIAGSINGSTVTERIYSGETFSLKCDGTTWRLHG